MLTSWFASCILTLVHKQNKPETIFMPTHYAVVYTSIVNESISFGLITQEHWVWDHFHSHPPIVVCCADVSALSGSRAWMGRLLRLQTQHGKFRIHCDLNDLVFGLQMSALRLLHVTQETVPQSKVTKMLLAAKRLSFTSIHHNRDTRSK